MVEIKISKDIGILFKGSLHLNNKCLSMVYFSFIHSYINYNNTVWASTFQTKLEKAFFMWKHRIIFYEWKEANTRLLLKKKML